MSDNRVLVTGASGGVGRLIRPRLAKPGRVLRLLDVAPPEPAEPGEAVEIVTGSILDPDVIGPACEGVDAVIHLGGLSREDTWEDILSVNVDGTHAVLEAARAAGVGRIVLASSNHAAGFRAVADAPGLPADSTPRPDTFYGVSKAAIEALGSLYHSRFGMDVVCIRLGTCFEAPWDERGLSTWLSPDDGARLFEACLTAPSPGYRIVWGVSDNTRRFLPLTEAEQLGYRSEDDAERFAEKILADAPATPPPGAEWIGGGFTVTPLGVHNPL